MLQRLYGANPAVMLIALLMLHAPRAALAETGDVLLEYRASSGALPEQQGWKHEGECLNADCPGSVCPTVSSNSECYYQGCRNLDGTPGIDNSCTLDVGCRKPDEQYNAPGSPLSESGSCSYTEWIVFDDGDNVTRRPLTINDAPDEDCLPGNCPPIVKVVDTPPFGANLFPGAPTEYPPLRLSTGSGDDAGRVLPVAQDNQGQVLNNRNGGKIKIRSEDLLSLPPGVTTVTLVARMAFGPWDLDPSDVCAELRIPSIASDRHWRIGITPPNSIPDDDGETHLGIVNRNDPSNEPSDYPFCPLSVRTYDSATATWSGGEFYTVRMICRADGTWSAFLNEQPSSVHDGYLGTPGEDDHSGLEEELQWGIVDRAGGANCTEGCGKTFWLDFIQVLEGEVWPTGCPDPVFDIDVSGTVDQNDFYNGLAKDFVSCATGPAPGSSVFDARPQWCQCLDVNDDKAVDQTDFAAFQRCLGLTGAAMEACDD